MADVQPLRALHYDLAAAGPLRDLIAPPYDVIDSEQRAALLARSPNNVVEIDLPIGGENPYADAAEQFDAWQRSGVLVRDEEPALWLLEQRYRGPDGNARTRHGFFARVGIEEYGAGRIRPHERTHPGPKEDRLRLTRATRANLSPIFALYSDPTGGAYGALASAAAGEPWGEAADGEGTVNRLWRCANPATIAATQLVLADSELLIADGHHRYETSRAYADEIGGDGEHRYVLMCLVALEDPGLEIFATHRLVGGLDATRRRALAEAIERDFDAQTVSLEELAPKPGRGPLELGYLDAGGPRRLRLRDQAIADAALPDMPEAYRELDTGVLEALLLKGALELSDEDISRLNGLGYARDAQEAIALIESGAYDAAFLMRPTPVEQVRAIAETGVNMPPKSTYFFPKVPTGLVFNLLA
ncbi:MAG TPA: DUF1015 domain-containing protein [Solirubrobacteraceae bacterium]|jgi:uncharacterized protein (DUF1015 family)|nr:DUF1015 domain-containing protein [Solirubrobacteraceae bacterium]